LYGLGEDDGLVAVRVWPVQVVRPEADVADDLLVTDRLDVAVHELAVD